jgi:hypothetical protein
MIQPNNLNNQVFMMNVPVPVLPRMNAAETLGVESVFQEVQRAFEPFYGPIPHPLNGPPYLRSAIFWALREIDMLQQQGHNLQNVLSTENLLRQIARTSYAGSQNPNEAPVPYENRPFANQILYMNLIMFILRYLIRVQPNLPVIVNGNGNANGNQP